MNRILSRALALVHTVIEYASIDGGRIIVGVRPWTSFGLRCPVCGRAANATTGRQGRGCGARWTWRGRPLRARAARDGGVPARLREDGRRGRAGLRLRLRGDDARRGRRREVRITNQRIRSSGFPYVKGLADFDWDFQPSVPAPRSRSSRPLRFVERAKNVLFVGSPGVGKTHLAVALGIEAVRAGREVRFVDCARLVEDLEDASSRGILKKRLKYYAHSRLLIIDELGYLDVGSAGADLLFQLILTRYEQRSTIITADVGIGGWGGVFGGDVAASAIADRVCHHCHHCHLVKIAGRSYRLKDLPRDGPVKARPESVKIR